MDTQRIYDCIMSAYASEPSFFDDEFEDMSIALPDNPWIVMDNRRYRMTIVEWNTSLPADEEFLHDAGIVFRFDDGPEDEYFRIYGTVYSHGGFSPEGLQVVKRVQRMVSAFERV